MADGAIDFQLLFEQSPDVLLVLRADPPRYTMVAATEARFQATHTDRESIGKGLFELFPDNPDDPGADGVRNLRASLDRVIATRAPDTMAVQKYDIPGPDGNFQVRYWSPKNIPILGPAGEVRFVIHRVEEVTDLVRAGDRNDEMEREVIRRSRELAGVVRELREANAKLGELAEAKAAFFSNVTHEFRTPLTLMLGPLEDSLADVDEPLGPAQRTRVGLAHDNALRLLKLVNGLLDFSRLEAGRLRASYAPLDLGRFTAELAGMFQSAVDKAGIRLAVDCPRFAEPAFVDREMWEKIVPNLISNAFKYTLEGEIAVRAREEPEQFVLEVADTGVGIPEAELPRIFERFHRVAGTTGRTHEGTGIGLSLVRELVELHGGTVSVDSAVGRGSTFRVQVPKGYAHLPSEAVSLRPADPTIGRDAAAHAAEASRWVGGSRKTQPAVSAPGAPRAYVLVVDDNADLREYTAGLLAPSYDVATAVDGRAALETIAERLPDVVVSDVMMPRLDGMGLVRELRADKRTASIPVILLSARAGEDSAVKGLDAESDDYLTKPFSARELIARVATHVELARARHAWIAELERTNRELDSFSYSVSHDLRAPLRAIDGFSVALAESSGEALGERGQASLGRIRANVRRMNSLIDDLLELSRIGRTPLRSGRVDLSRLAVGVVEDLRRAHPSRAVAVVIPEGLVAHGDRSLLQILLVDLVGNAWKFTAKTEEAQIELGRHDGKSGEDSFFVRDNGAGFDMAHASRLFGAFQRLHAAHDFEGTGIGLATVQRIVSRHGGQVWADAAPGRGATFYFSLPAAVQ